MQVTRQINTARLTACTEQVEALARKAAKHGLPGPAILETGPAYWLKVERSTHFIDGKAFTDFDRYRVCDVVIDWPADIILPGGWQWQGMVEVSTGLTFGELPGELVPAADNRGYCDHCKRSIRRKYTHIVKSTETGEVKQLGGQCVKLYTGIDASALSNYVLTLAAASEDIERSVEGIKYAYDIKQALALGLHFVSLHGYESTKEIIGTVDRVYEVYSSLKSDLPDRRDAAIKLLIDAPAKYSSDVAKIREYVNGLDHGCTGSEYHRNLFVLIGRDAGAVPADRLGLALSAIAAYNRDNDRAAAAEAREPFAGDTGKRYSLEIDVVSSRAVEGNYGTRFIVKALTVDGKALQFWYKDEVDEGRYSIKGTYKGQADYRGDIRGELSRVAF